MPDIARPPTMIIGTSSTSVTLMVTMMLALSPKESVAVSVTI